MLKQMVFMLFCLLPTILLAQFQINTEIRPRTEYRNGYKLLATDATSPAFLTSQRSRIYLNYQSPQFSYGLTLQDVRIWGDETLYSSTGVTGDNASVDIHEAWLEVKINPASAVKMGRQMLKYDNERLLAVRNWNQYSIVYDALVYKFSKNSLAIDLALSLNNEKDNTFGNLYPPAKMKTLNFIHLQKKINPSFQAVLLALATGYTPSATSDVIYMRSTLGTYLTFAPNPYQIATEAYYQTGKNNLGADVAAWLLGADAKIKLNKFSPGVGFVMFSGQDGLKSDADYQQTDHLFDLLYGTRHRFYGTLDYFSNMPKDTKNGGLVDLYLQLPYFYSGKNSLQVDYHYFALQNNVINPTTATSGVQAYTKYLGSEIDFALDHNFNENLNLKGGYSVMLPSETLESFQNIAAGESKHSGWGWVMLTFKHQLFKAE